MPLQRTGPSIINSIYANNLFLKTLYTEACQNSASSSFQYIASECVQKSVYTVKNTEDSMLF